MRMPFGRYTGVELGELPESYLLWVLEKSDNAGPVLKKEIRRVLGLEEEDEQPRYVPPPPPRYKAPPQPPRDCRAVVERCRQQVVDAVQKCRRKVAAVTHPDRGGDVKTMQVANGGFDQLIADIAAAFDSVR